MGAFSLVSLPGELEWARAMGKLSKLSGENQMAAIPLTWDDPIFSGATTSRSVTLANGGALSNTSITDTGHTASVVGRGSFTLDGVRISSREGVRIGGSGDVVINNSYLESKGQGNDHADTIQIYAPGSTGNVTITNTTIVAHNTAATAGMFVADEWSGTLTFNNVVFKGGPFGLRVATGADDISVALKDVYFVGPFGYGDLLFQEVTADIHITQWENVRSATIVNGEIVPGALISPPFPVVGGSSAPAIGAPTIDSFSDDSGTAGDGITNDNTITLKGKAAANSTVKVFDGTKQIGTVSATKDGTWSFNSAVLSDGAHKFTVTATSSGVTSQASAVQSLTIDTVAPAAPTITMSTSAATLASTQIAKLNGTAEANSTVKVFDGSTQIGTATANNSGAWTFTTKSLSNGGHNFTAKATDAAGNTGAASTALSVTITPPLTPSEPTAPSSPNAPTIASFSHDSGKVGDFITNDNTLTLKGAAAANSTVKFYDGAKYIGATTSDSKGAWSFTTATLVDGAHNLTAKVTDAQGKTGPASSTLSVTIDTQAPGAPTLGVFTDKGKAVSGTTTVDDFLLKGTAEANSTIKVFDAGKQIGTATTKADGTWSFDTGPLADGKHSFTSSAVDAAGNVSGLSVAKGITVLDAPGASTTYVNLTDANHTWSKSVVIKGTADAYSQIKIFDGEKAIGSVTSDSGGSWSYSTYSSPNAVNSFSAKQVDNSGKVVASSGSVITGTNGSDILKSTSGDDVFIGNGGTDTFVFAENFGNDTIKDFEANYSVGWRQDKIEFSKNVFTDFADMISHASQVGQDVVISTGNDSLTLKNATLSGFSHYDFHFA